MGTRRRGKYRRLWQLVSRAVRGLGGGVLWGGGPRAVRGGATQRRERHSLTAHLLHGPLSAETGRRAQGVRKDHGSLHSLTTRTSWIFTELITSSQSLHRSDWFFESALATFYRLYYIVTGCYRFIQPLTIVRRVNGVLEAFDSWPQNCCWEQQEPLMKGWCVGSRQPS